VPQAKLEAGEGGSLDAPDAGGDADADADAAAEGEGGADGGGGGSDAEKPAAVAADRPIERVGLQSVCHGFLSSARSWEGFCHFCRSCHRPEAGTVSTISVVSAVGQKLEGQHSAHAFITRLQMRFGAP
jgi:hypothetical protein